MFSQGETVLIETNYQEDGCVQAHLFVIILDIDRTSQMTIIIPIDTIRGPKFDKQTLLGIGCHDFVTHNSYVNYKRARIVSSIELDNLIQRGIAKKRTPFSGELLERIKDGILKSDFTSMEIREMYSSHLFDSF